MVSAVNAAASGLHAASVRVDVAAHNIANASTPGFEPAQVTSAEAPGGGAVPVVIPGEPVLPADPPAPSGTDLVTEMASLLMARIAVTANARALAAAAALYRELTDSRG
jgi:flagellar basal-body rod protein FlgC